MSAWQEIAMIIGMMLVTFGVRYPVLALAGRIAMPKALQQALQFVPVAVLVAITVPILLKPEGQWFISLQNAHLLAGLVAILVALGSRHLLLTIAIGMSVFVVLQLL